MQTRSAQSHCGWRDKQSVCKGWGGGCDPTGAGRLGGLFLSLLGPNVPETPLVAGQAMGPFSRSSLRVSCQEIRGKRRGLSSAQRGGKSQSRGLALQVSRWQALQLASARWLALLPAGERGKQASPLRAAARATPFIDGPSRFFPLFSLPSAFIGSMSSQNTRFFKDLCTCSLSRFSPWEAGKDESHNPS